MPTDPHDDADDVGGARGGANGRRASDRLLPGAGGAGRILAPATRRPEEAALRVLWRRRRVMAAAVGAALLLGGAYLEVARPLYTSSADVFVEPTGPRVLGDAVNGDGSRSENYLNNQAKLLASEPILALALADPGVAALPTFAGVERPIALLKANVSVDVGKKDDVLTVNFEGPYRDDSAAVVNAVVRAYAAYQSRQQRNTGGELLQILDKEQAKDRDLLKQIDGKMSDYRMKYGAFASGGDARGDLATAQLATLADALTRAHLETIDAEGGYASARRMLGGDPATLAAIESGDGAAAGPAGTAPADYAAVAASPANQETLRTEIFRQQQLLGDLQRAYLPGHPQVRAATARLRQLTVAFVAAAHDRLALARAREAGLSDSYDQQQKKAVEQSAKASEFASLASDKARVERDLDVLASRINEVGVGQEGGGLNISVLEEARPAEKPSHPSRKVALALSLIGGLLAGAGLSFWREAVDPAAPGHDAADPIKAALGVPMLGLMPPVVGYATAAERATAVALDRSSAVAEAVRAVVRAAAYFGLEPGRSHTVAFTSPVAAEGRTTVLMAVALTMAQAGQRVLVVDADFRHPCLANLLDGGEGGPGLSSLITGHDPVERVVCRTAYENLDVLPAGPVPEDPAALLNNPALIDVLNDLSGRYDRVLIDAPASAAGTDARLIAACCDATVLVLSPSRSDRRMTERTRDALTAVGARLIGAVINEMPRHADAALPPASPRRAAGALGQQQQQQQQGPSAVAAASAGTAAGPNGAVFSDEPVAAFGRALLAANATTLTGTVNGPVPLGGGGGGNGATGRAAS